MPPIATVTGADVSDISGSTPVCARLVRGNVMLEERMLAMCITYVDVGVAPGKGNDRAYAERVGGNSEQRHLDAKSAANKTEGFLQLEAKK